MSQSQSRPEPQQSSSGAEYSAYDWWGDNDADDGERVGHDPEEFNYRRERAQYVAHAILKETGTLVCPVALNAPPDRLTSLFEWLETGEAQTGHDPGALHSENELVELTEPEVYLPLETTEEYGGRTLEYGQRPTKTRTNPKHGYVVGPQILSRPEDEFMEVTRMVLDHLSSSAEQGLSRRERDKLERDAERMKGAGDRKDETILATIIHDATSEGPILDDN